MRSKISVVLLTIPIGLILAWLPIWPVLNGVGIADDFENQRSRTFYLWGWDSLIDFYHQALNRGELRPIEVISFYDLMTVIYPFILMFLAWIISEQLRKALIYLWDLP